MNKGGLAVAGALVGFGVWWFYRKTQAEQPSHNENWLDDLPQVFDSAVNAVSDVVGDLSGGFMKVSAMKNVTVQDLQNPNVQAFLRVIRAGEGTSDDGGYRRLFGGGTFNSFADHPRIVVKKSGYASSAAGAYQFLASSWDETKRIMGLADFSPANQDLGAVGRIMARGALDDVKAGRFEAAIKKCAREWASLPYSPYGQPVMTMSKATSIYLAYSGKVAAGATV